MFYGMIEKNMLPFFEEDGGASGEIEFSFDEGQPEPEQSEPTAEESTEEPAEVETKPKDESEQEVFKVRHNRQDIELTREQLIKAAQQGLDYDRVREGYDRYKTPIERLAKQAGMSTDQFLTEIDGMLKTSAVEAAKAGYIAKGVDEDLAAEMAERDYELETLRNGHTFQQQQQQMQSAEEARLQADIEAFEAKYPDVKELPPEVVEAIKDGDSPLVAYQSYLIRENEKKLKAVEQNNTNKMKSSGPAKTIGEEKQDDFLAAFSRDY
jgi:hypothetical protein